MKFFPSIQSTQGLSVLSLKTQFIAPTTMSSSIQKSLPMIGEEKLIASYNFVYTLVFLNPFPGALSLQRHRRIELYSPSADSEAGVRLSCPLDRIIDFQTHCSADFLHLVAFRVQLTPADCKEDVCEGMSESPVIQVGPVHHIPIWDQLEDRIEIAKRRVQNQPPNPQSVFFVDFGPFRFLQRDNVASKHEGYITHREKAIRAALGFAAESELWCG